MVMQEMTKVALALTERLAHNTALTRVLFQFNYKFLCLHDSFRLFIGVMKVRLRRFSCTHLMIKIKCLWVKHDLETNPFFN